MSQLTSPLCLYPSSRSQRWMMGLRLWVVHRVPGDTSTQVTKLWGLQGHERLINDYIIVMLSVVNEDCHYASINQPAKQHEK